MPENKEYNDKIGLGDEIRFPTLKSRDVVWTVVEVDHDVRRIEKDSFDIKVMRKTDKGEIVSTWTMSGLAELVKKS